MQAKTIVTVTAVLGVVAISSLLYSSLRASATTPLPPGLEELPRNLHAHELNERLSSKPSGSASPPGPTSASSDAYIHAQRLRFFESNFASQPRDRAAASQFETAVSSYFSKHAAGALQAVECRTTLCKVELIHTTGKTRDQLGLLWGDGPLTFGSYDFLEGDSTIAFIGMPGRPLSILDSTGAPQ